MSDPNTSNTAPAARAVPPTSFPMPPSRLMVLMFTDIVGSVDLKNRIGTGEYAAALAKHDQLFKRLVLLSPGAEILTDVGDGFFACFASSADAVRTALLFQSELARLARPLHVRVGLHVGEVTQVGISGNERPKVIGLAADLASRITNLAGADQILLSRFPFNEARQFVRSHPPLDDGSAPEVRWVAHGEYLFKGSDEPMEVFEVGTPNLAPLAPPSDNDDARRAVRPGDEVTLGWRPANGLEMPTRAQWIIKEKLGEGGFGEVWLAEHAKTRMRRVFKFCFDSQRLRALKREVILFRLLKDALGDRRDIARVTDYQFDESPYFIEYEYVPGGALQKWAASIGGIVNVPLAKRIWIVARIAEALAAAHSVGVIHKDVKPSNVLVASADGDPSDLKQIYPVLTDFGIGILTDRTALDRHDITSFGFTQSAMTANESSRTGTRLYAPPESLTDRPYTVQGDIFALGVLLYQMTIADFDRPLATGWSREIEDALLREDIEACVQGDPAHRLASAAELSRRLDTLDARRAERETSARASRMQAQRRRLVRGLAALLVVAIGASAFLAVALRERSRRLTSETHRRTEAEASRDRIAKEAAKSNAMTEFLTGMLASAGPEVSAGESLTVREVLDRAAARIAPIGMPAQPEVESAVRGAIGTTYRTLGLYDAAAPQLEKALELAVRTYGENHPHTGEACDALASLKQDAGDLAGAELLYQRALATKRRTLPPDAPDVLSSERNYSTLLSLKGDYKGATELLKHVVSATEAHFGKDDARTAAAMTHLAATYTRDGNFADAESLLKSALDINQAKLSPGHPDSIDALSQLGRLYQAWGKFDLAEPAFVKEVELCEKTYGPEHPATAQALGRLGLFYGDVAKYSEAETALKRALEIKEKAHPGDHPSTAATLDDLGLLYLTIEKLDLAEMALKRSLAMAERVLGPEHIDVAAILDNLAQVYEGKNDWVGAEQLFKRDLAIREKVLGPDHINTLLAVNNLGLMYYKRARYVEAEPLLVRAISIVEKTKGPDHPDTATVLANLSMLYSKTHRENESEPLLRRALAIREKALGPDHPSVALSYNDVAILLDTRKDYAGSDAAYLKAIALSERTLGRTHSQSMQLLFNRAVMLKHAGRYADADAALRDMLDRAAEIKHPIAGLSAMSERVDVLAKSNDLPAARIALEAFRAEVAKVTDAQQRQRWDDAITKLQGIVDAAATRPSDSAR